MTTIIPAYIHALPEARAGATQRLKEYAADLGLVITEDEAHPNVVVPKDHRVFSRKQFTQAYEFFPQEEAKEPDTFLPETDPEAFTFRIHDAERIGREDSWDLVIERLWEAGYTVEDGRNPSEFTDLQEALKAFGITWFNIHRNVEPCHHDEHGLCDGIVRWAQDTFVTYSFKPLPGAVIRK